jgi:hypothetical protein
MKHSSITRLKQTVIQHRLYGKEAICTYSNKTSDPEKGLVISNWNGGGSIPVSVQTFPCHIAGHSGPETNGLGDGRTETANPFSGSDVLLE